VIWMISNSKQFYYMNFYNINIYFEQSNKASIIKSILGDVKLTNPNDFNIDDFILKLLSFSICNIFNNIDSPSGPCLI